MSDETRAELDLRLAENGWTWRTPLDASVWSSRIMTRMATALFDPDRRAGEHAAREAFVDGLEDASKAGAIVRAPSPATIAATPRLALIR